MKTGLLASAVVLGMVLPLALSTGASAADTDTTADSASKSASVTVTGGDLQFTKDENSMQEAPSFQFGDAKVSTGEQTGLKATGFSNKNTADTYTGSVLSVDDDRGTGAGWTVSAALGAFSDDANHILTGAQLKMNAAIPSGTATAPAATLTAADSASDTATAVPVFTAAKDAGMGTSTTDLKGATLDLPSAEYAGTYTAPLTYTLTAGPTE
ncbi:MAG: WxL domain-containing protein [Levilactobacillus sp.]|uniref:WxL domain-containing protein n=1 Tax=Levilactobacillus sp. TaxID=2767919 RepID=UPI002582ED47|nr:WxL domain-containing protein [Levilactobacillus sp.]MCI1553079.1 WxL domain-containing protein [Levilactobacillus sp.]MCI1598734.1 WxL domain-containing protein [Levilactobacillus sp.]MCI1605083.1 WxL domain-containing protein [Levilactobacillus sp.]